MKNDSETLARIEAQLAVLDKKIDTLMHSSQKPVERERSSFSKERSSFSNRGFGDKPKMTYKAVCAQCGQTCGVPFKPVGGRPVFCSECFAKQQGEGSTGESGFHKKPRDFRKPIPGKKPYFKKK
jgi:CxxC-x17-CxxC domain-containing protein